MNLYGDVWSVLLDVGTMPVNFPKVCLASRLTSDGVPFGRVADYPKYPQVVHNLRIR